LLLTFFYRQMPELIERGHIYIAQPPLYKVKKGKQETYIKDDLELNQYLLHMALEGAELHVNSEAPPMSASALESLAQEFIASRSIIKRLAKRYDDLLLEKLIYMPAVNTALLADKKAFAAWLRELEQRLNADQKMSHGYRLERVSEEAGQPEAIVIVHATHGIENRRYLPMEFFNSGDYQKLKSLGEKLDGLIEEGAFIKRGDKKQTIHSFSEALDWLMAEGRRGQHVQRYKGLGEMNPDQLWETTMDPDSRRLLQVRIEDAVGADEVFTTLMGDEVEPRREFIETNALEVENLDI